MIYKEEMKFDALSMEILMLRMFVSKIWRSNWFNRYDKTRVQVWNNWLKEEDIGEVVAKGYGIMKKYFKI
jgi:hypothetical protein